MVEKTADVPKKSPRRRIGLTEAGLERAARATSSSPADGLKMRAETRLAKRDAAWSSMIPQNVWEHSLCFAD